MRPTRRLRVASAVLVAGASIGAYAAVTAATAAAGPAHVAKTAPSIKRFNLNGYVINTDYSLGRNKGNTFQQTYKSGPSTVSRSRARSSAPSSRSRTT